MHPIRSRVAPDAVRAEGTTHHTGKREPHSRGSLLNQILKEINPIHLCKETKYGQAKLNYMCTM